LTFIHTNNLHVSNIVAMVELLTEIPEGAAGWFRNWAGTGATASIFFIATYFFAMRIIDKATEKGWTKIRIPGGFVFESNGSVEAADSDAMILEGVHESIQQLEFRAKERMRKIMNRVCGKWSVANPQCAEFITKGKLSFSYAISDNHIIFSLAEKRIGEYIKTKQEQLYETIGDERVFSKDVKKVLDSMVEDFVYQIIPVQESLCLNKLEVYEEALTNFKVKGAKVRCQTKIKKNQDYLDALAKLSCTLVRTTLTEIGGDADSDDMTGSRILIQSMEKITRIAADMDTNKKPIKSNKNKG